MRQKIEWWLVIFVCSVVVGVWANSVFPVASDESLHFQKVTVAALAGGKVHMTRAEVTGEVDLRKTEADGDIHMRITDGKSFIVAECMPEIDGLWQQCSKVKVGSTVTIQGITRFDDEHKWYEIHPVEHLQVGK